MARTGENENKQAQKDFAAQRNKAYKIGQTSIAAGQAGLETLKAGENIGVNPFDNPEYQGEQNRLTANALNASTDAGEQELEAWNERTGGLSGGATPYVMSDLTLKKMRLSDQLNAQRKSQEYLNNLAWQQYLESQNWMPAQLEAPYYSTSTSGQGNALNNLTQLGLASYGPWNSLISAAGSAAGGALSNSKLVGCWIAEAIYGAKDPRTHILRLWLNTDFKEHAFGRIIMALYLRFGQRVAAVIRRVPMLGWGFRPLFELALWRAKKALRGEPQPIPAG